MRQKETAPSERAQFDSARRKHSAMRLIQSASVLVLAVGCLAPLSGCAPRGRLEDAMMFGSQSKQTALQERLDRFNRARYWGGLSESLAYISDDYRSEFANQERELAGNQRIVRTDITKVEVKPGGDSATVEMEVRYFEKPTYLVKTRTEEQTWKFHRFGGGWLLTGAQPLSMGEVDESGPSPMRGMPSRSPYNF